MNWYFVLGYIVGVSQNIAAAVLMAPIIGRWFRRHLHRHHDEMLVDIRKDVTRAYSSIHLMWQNVGAKHDRLVAELRTRGNYGAGSRVAQQQDKVSPGETREESGSAH